MLNGLSVAGLSEFVQEVRESPEEANVHYGVALAWETGTRSRVSTLPMSVGPHRVARDFEWTIDEPRQLLGTNQGPNPQEFLLAGVGGCLLVGYAVGASVMGIQVEELDVEVRGEIDLRGFLAVDETAPVAFRSIEYRVTIASDGTEEQLEELHRQVLARSPNRMTVAEGVPVEGRLVVSGEAPRNPTVEP